MIEVEKLTEYKIPGGDVVLLCYPSKIAASKYKYAEYRYAVDKLGESERNAKKSRYIGEDKDNWIKENIGKITDDEVIHFICKEIHDKSFDFAVIGKRISYYSDL